LALREFHPEIGIEGRCGGALQNGGRHPRYLKPNAFLSEHVNKPCERRNCSSVLHLSSGVMVRLRAKRTQFAVAERPDLSQSPQFPLEFFLFTKSICAATVVLSRNAEPFFKKRFTPHSTR
jgi:hypothetical protein